MFVIKLKNQNGAALLSTVFFLILLGMIGMSLVTMLVADSRLGMLNSEARKAFYAAHSGLEYGIKTVFVTDPTSLSDWSETVDTGDGTTCEVSAEFLSNNRVRIRAEGHSARFAERLEKVINYIDISEYAVYTSGNVQNVVAHEWPPSSIFSIPNNPALVYQNAPVMPVFDPDELRENSKPNGYKSGDYTVTSIFNFPPKRTIFVEGNLTFDSWSWLNWGHFTVMGDVVANGPWLPFSTVYGTVYQPNAGSQFTSPPSLLRRSFIGGVILNGSITGNNWILGSSNLFVFHYRPVIINFMRYSLNGGPMVIENSRWDNLN